MSPNQHRNLRRHKARIYLLRDDPFCKLSASVQIFRFLGSTVRVDGVTVCIGVRRSGRGVSGDEWTAGGGA